MTRTERPRDATISLQVGAGGRAMRELVESVFVRGAYRGERVGECGGVSGLAAASPAAAAEDGGAPVGLEAMDDGAAVRLGDRWLVVTTDSHVIQPVFFPGGDIGRLAIAGTVNDLAMMGATEVLGLTCAVILEEGYRRADLEAIQASIRRTCAEAGAPVLTGDTKVMGRGELDGIVINTSGVGLTRRVVPDSGLRPGDRLLVTGNIGDHGLAVMAVRDNLGLESELRSDVAPLNGLVESVLAAGGPGVVAMKDPTRGGLASALHEMALKSQVGIDLDEAAVPVDPAARSASELLGIDPLQVANEGKAVIGVAPDALDAVLAALHAHPLGKRAAVVGRCSSEVPGTVRVDTGLGRRWLAEPEGDLVPRIC